MKNVCARNQISLIQTMQAYCVQDQNRYSPTIRFSTESLFSKHVERGFHKSNRSRAVRRCSLMSIEYGESFWDGEVAGCLPNLSQYFL